ncbi:acyl-CoA dehydrogenase family protein [Dactylosporangium sp. CA-092794]|uniref:acyl-CoA dehydrogenase family protein n=1 Tax=Dactylosporangium sp. CA-092794 TaxID=3239929 RepID=UPI003D8F782C
MSWDFSTEPEFEHKLGWMRRFVAEEIIPLETLRDRWRAPGGATAYAAATAGLKDEVRRQGLWAAHLPPELGGTGFGQVKLALMHEIIGQSPLAAPIFGNNAPDSGNAEMLALAGTPRQKEQWMAPLLDGRMYSSYSMTEPGAGADPRLLRTTARLDGDEWVIDGHKWFISNASVADFHIVMCRTSDDPELRAHKRFSMIIVPSATPGVTVLRDIPTMENVDHRFGEFGNHAEVRYESVRVPRANLIGDVGEGFALAQKRLGPGRVHHAMRWLGQSRRAFDMLCERAVSRFTHGSVLADKQLVQDWVAQSWASMQAARLLTLQAAWTMDRLHEQGRPHSDAKIEIGVIKFWGARVLYEVIDRAIQVHGALGYSADLPLEAMYRKARAARLVDGPDEVHKTNVARQILKGYTPTDVPSQHIPTMRARAEARFARYLDDAAVNS